MNTIYLKPAEHLEPRRHHVRKKPAVFRIVYFLFAFCLLLIGNKGWGQTYTHTISAKTWSAYGTQTLSSVDWTAAATGGAYWGYDATKGQQFGSSGAPATALSLTTSGISGTITSIKVSTSGASSVAATLGVTVGGSAFGGSAQAISATNTTYTFTGSASGTIVLNWTQTSSKALYLKTIEITYSSGCTAPTLSMQGTPIQNITTTGAGFYGNIGSVGGGTKCTTRGFQYSTNSSLTSPTDLSEGGGSGNYNTGNYNLSSSALTANTVYYYRSYATNDCATPQTGYSHTSGYPSFTTIHNAPTIGTGSNASSSSFTAGWSAPTGGGSATYTYEIQVDDDNAFGSVNFTQNSIASGTLTCNVNTGLSPSTTYYYRVRAVNAGGNSAWSSVSVGYATLAGATTISSQNFTTCDPVGWVTYSVTSSANWTCDATNGYEWINSYNGGVASNDWLISPALNLNSYTSEILTFRTYNQYKDDGIANPETKLYYSTNYAGSGDPSSATWTQLTYAFPGDNAMSWTVSGNVDLSGITGSSVYIAFQHTSSGTTAGSSSLWRVDDYLITGYPAACTNPTLSGASQAATVCAGSTATINLTGMVANTTGNAIDYTINGVSQTQVTGVSSNGSGVASFNCATLTSANNGQTLQITKITNGSCSSTFAQNATLSVDPTSVGGSITGGTSVCSGTNSTLLTLSGNTGSVTKWQYSTDNWSSSTDVANTTTSLTATNLTQTTKYRAVVQSGTCSSINSSDATITVVSSATSIAPTGAQNIVVSTNGTVLNVSPGTCTVTGQEWKYTTTSGSGYTSFSPAQTGTSYTPNFSSAGTYYVVCLTTYGAPCSTTITSSNEVQINVTANSISVTPASFGPVCNTSTYPVNLTYTTTGTVTTPFIELSNSSGSFASGTANLGGTITGSGPYTITANIPISQAAGTYRIRVKSTDATPVISSDNGSNITVNAAATPTISISASLNPICAGTTVTYTATITNGGTPSYQWKRNGTTDVGSNSSTYAPTAGTQVFNGDKITCILTATGCVSSTTVTSNEITQTVTVVPDIVTVSGAGTFCTSTTLTASGGTNGTIYWQSTTNNGTSLSTASTSQPVYSTGTYYFRSYNSGCWGQQGSAAVTINTAPGISAQPSNQTVSAPATATFSVTATGTGLTYQWQLSTNSGGSWSDISSATSSSYTTGTTTTGMSGYQYRCVVSGASPCSSVTSNAATLTVNAGAWATYEFTNVQYLAPTNTPANVTLADMALSSGTISTGQTTGSDFPNEPFISASGWTATDQASAKNFYFTITPDPGYELSITGISFNALATSAGPSAFSFDIDNGAATYTANAPDGSLLNINQTVSGVTGKTSTVTIKIQGWLNGSRTSTGSGTFRLDDVILYGTCASSASQITVSPTSLSNLNYNLGSGPSSAQTYTLNGTGLSPASGNVTITPPSNFEISLDNGTNYYSTAQSLAYTGSTITNKVIYVRLKSSLAANNYTGNIGNAGGGAANKNVAVSGWVIKAEPSSNVTSFQCSSGTTTSIPLTWIDAAGAVTPDGYLIMWSNTAYPSDPGTLADLTPVADSPGSISGALNVASGVGTANITGLSSGTQYYFRIWSYTNSGSYINYKLGSAPTSTCVTLSAPCATNGFEGGIGGGTGGTWTLPGAGAFCTNDYANAHDGVSGGPSWWAGCNSAGDLIRAPQQTNPQTISFWAKISSGATFTFVIESSVDGITWSSPIVTYTQSDFSTSYSQKTVNLGLSGSYYLRFNMTARSAGQIYLDDVEIYCNNLTPSISITTPAVSSGNVEQNADKQVIYKATISPTVTYAALQSISFTTSGTYGGNYDMKTPAFKLWYNSSSNDINSASQIGTSQNSDYSGAGETITFTTLNTSIASGSTGYFWITADIGCTAAIGRTISVNAMNNVDFTFTSSSFATSGPYTAGGAQTVIATSTSTDVTSLAATTESNGTTSVSWTNPTCLDELIIVVKTGGHVSGTPSGTYTANSLSFTDALNPAFPGGGVVVYNYTSPTSPKVVTNLTAGTTYHIKVFTKKGNIWSTGVEVDVTPTAKVEPSANPTAFLCGTSTSTSIPFSWTGATGAVLPDNYLIKWSTGTLASIQSPSDGTFISDGSTADGAYAVNVVHAAGTNSYTLTSMPTNTTVNFKIWSYTNSGTAVNYKTDDDPTVQLSGTCSTQPDPCLTESFESSFPSVGWTNGGAFQKTSGTICAGTKMVGFNLEGDYLITPMLTSPNLLTFQYKRSSSTTNWTMRVQYAENVSGPWTTIQSIPLPGDELCHPVSINLGLSGFYYLRFLDDRPGNGTEERYIDDINVYCVTTICTPPTTGPSNLTSGTVTNNSMVLNWTSGNGSNRIVVAKPGSPVDFVPVDGHTYTANTDYSAAADLSPTGNRVVYNGNSNTATVSGLTAGTTYYFKVFEYDCLNGSQAYNTTSTATTNNTTFPSPVTDLDVSCQTNNSATIFWTEPEGNYSGVIIGIRHNAACHYINSDQSNYIANSTFPGTVPPPAPPSSSYGTTSEYSWVVYKGTGTSVIVYGLTSGEAYQIKAYTYLNETGSIWSTTQPTTSITSLGVPTVSSVQASPLLGSAQVMWVNPSSDCFSNIMVVAKLSSAATAIPSGYSYVADANFAGSGSAFDGGKVVYLGGTTGSSTTVTGLANNTQYCFTVYVWNGSAWSIGVSDCCTTLDAANSPTVFVPGDVAVMGVNSNIYSCEGGQAGDDQISIVFFQDITTGTTIDMTDNGWERCTADHFGNFEGFLRIRYTGTNPITKGTIITFRFLNNSPYFQVLYPDPASGYTWVIDQQEGSLVFNTAGDQIYFMQGGTWNQGSSGTCGTSTNNATYTGGTYLFAFNTNDEWIGGKCCDNNIIYPTDPLVGTGRSQNSALKQGMECFSMTPRVATDYLKYVGPLTDATQRDWITRLKDPDYWNPYSGCAAYDASLPNYLSTTSINILPGTGTQQYSAGTWTGALNTDWFDCSNWGNLRVPDKTVDVTLPASGVTNNCTIGAPGLSDQPSEHYTEASCKNLTNSLSGYTFNINHSASKLDIWGNYTTNATFSHTAGLVTFKGTTAQTHTGVATFYNLTLNNSNGLTLYNNINVDGTITLTSGILTTQSANTIDLRSGGTIVEGASSTTPTSYVTGNVKATRDIGSSTNQTFGGIGLELNETTTSSNSTVVIRTTGINITSPIFSIKRYFNITPAANTGLNATMIFHYFDHEITGFTESNLDLYKSDNTYSTFYAQSGTMNISNNTCTKSGITGFSIWTLADKTNNPLPIELLQFEAACNNDKVDLAWTTATEINNDYFTIEKSDDAKRWNEVANVTGAGNSNQLMSYKFSDENYSNKTIYYRLKQTDYDGTAVYFEPVAVTCKDEYKSINVYPNPATDITTCSIYSNEALKAILEISNYFGSIVLEKEINLQPGFNMINFEVSGYQSGLYSVLVRGKAGEIIGYKKFVVKK